MIPPRIELVAKRQEDLQGGRHDYSVYAGAQLVGRIYQMHHMGSSDNWFWGVNGLAIVTASVMHGHAKDLDDAKAKLRAAFNHWLVCARAVPTPDLRYPRIAAELENMRVGD